MSNPSKSCYIISGVTGAVGSNLASLFISKGYTVVGITRKKPSFKDKKLLTGIKWLVYDYSDNNIGLENKLKKITTGLKVIGVYQCAGKHHRDYPLNHSAGDFLHLLKANLISTINIVSSSINLLHKNSSIVILNSQASIKNADDEIGYGVAKAALSKYIESMQFEATKRKIQIINILCGAIQTNMVAYRDDYKKFIKIEDLVNFLYSLSEVGDSIRINNLEILRRNY